jgi:peptide/nickel transport system substrate-binding protein
MKSRGRIVPPSARHRKTSSSAGWPLLLVLAGGLVAVATAWFAFSDSFADNKSPRAYRYVEAVVGSPSRVNPLFAHLNAADRDLSSLVFSGLTRLGKDGTVLPDLAERWETNSDGHSVTFHIRPGVSWHNGTPFNSADVVFTYSLLADPSLEADPGQAPLWRKVTCSAPDDLTVVCQLPDPFAPFPAYATQGILPKQLLQGTDARALATSSFNQNPVGTGPYKMVSLDATRAVLHLDDNYHLGTPKVTEIELRFFPDSATAAASVVHGETNGVFLDTTAAPQDLDTAASVDGLKSYEAIPTAYTVLYLNNSQTPLNDVLVRRAIAETIDIDGIIDSLLGGRAVRAGSPIVNGTWAYNRELEGLRHDTDDARNLLGQAGWITPDDGAVRVRNGVEFRLTLLTDRDPVRGLISGAIAQQLADIGIAVTLAPQEPSNLIRDFLIPRQYQAALFGWDPGPDPDPYPAWHSSQASDSGRNLAAYANQQADQLMEQARVTSNVEERQRLYYEFQKVFQQDVPSVLLYHPRNTYFVTEQIKGIQLGVLFSPSSRFGNVHEWVFEEGSDIRNR